MMTLEPGGYSTGASQWRCLRAHVFEDCFGDDINSRDEHSDLRDCVARSRKAGFAAIKCPSVRLTSAKQSESQ